jgi:hypothetical protein
VGVAVGGAGVGVGGRTVGVAVWVGDSVGVAVGAGFVGVASAGGVDGGGCMATVATGWAGVVVDSG